MHHPPSFFWNPSKLYAAPPSWHFLCFLCGLIITILVRRVGTLMFVWIAFVYPPQGICFVSLYRLSNNEPWHDVTPLTTLSVLCELETADRYFKYFIIPSSACYQQHTKYVCVFLSPTFCCWALSGGPTSSLFDAAGAGQWTLEHTAIRLTVFSVVVRANKHCRYIGTR